MNRDYWKQKDDRERRAKLPYWKKIIEGLTGYEVLNLVYNSDREYLEVIWANQHMENYLLIFTWIAYTLARMM